MANLLHRLTHRCRHLAKPGVGEVWVCHNRITRTCTSHGRAEGDTTWKPLPGAWWPTEMDSPEQFRAWLTFAAKADR